MVTGVIDREYENKHFLYTPNDKVENVYVLKDGEVTLYQSVDGRKIVLDILKPGAVFGNIGFDSDTSQSHFAQATQKSYICTLPHNYFLQILKKRPDIALRVLNVMHKKLSQYHMQIRALSALQARDRILAMVRILNQQEDESILPDVLRKPTKTTHEKLGQMTGLTRETVTKELKKLEAEGLIIKVNKNLRLTEKGSEAVMALAA